MSNRKISNGHRALSGAAALMAGLLLLSSCGPPAPARGSKQADVWYCFAMDRTGKKWAYKAENIEDASGASMKACKKESVEPSSCQAPEASNCSNTGGGRVID